MTMNQVNLDCISCHCYKGKAREMMRAQTLRSIDSVIRECQEVVKTGRAYAEQTYLNSAKEAKEACKSCDYSKPLASDIVMESYDALGMGVM
jgi:hypothetical protein